MNYEKFQNINKYLKSLQNSGVASYDLNGYQNYINNSKLYHQRAACREPPNNSHQFRIYAPASAVSSSYLTNPRMFPSRCTSNFYQDYCYNEKTGSGKSSRELKHKNLTTCDSSKINLSYMGEDRDIAESYLKVIESQVK